MALLRPGASWCDVVLRREGLVDWVYTAGTSVVCESAETGAHRWSRAVGDHLRYLSAGIDGHGSILAAGQGDTGAIRGVIDGVMDGILSTSPFPFSVLVRGEAEGWTVFVQRTDRVYDELRVSPEGHIASTTPRTFAELDPERPTTSQGFVQLRDGQPVTQDAGRIVHGLSLPSRAGTVWAGQSQSAFRVELFDETTGRLSIAREGVAQPPHIVQRGEDFFLCAYVDGAAWCDVLRRPFIPIGPAPVDPPPVIPPKEPPVSEDVRHVPNLITVIEQTKRDFPNAWKNCHHPERGQEASEEFARRAGYACSLVDPRFGLNGKRGDPNDLSDDCVCFLHDDGRESVIDFGGGAGGDNPTVQWSIVGHYQVPGPPLQRWIKAERVSGAPSQPGVPPPPPPPPPPTASAFPVPHWPEDVFLRALTRYINEGLYERDKPVENAVGDRTSSRGGLMWFVPIATAELIADIAANRNTLPTPERWWALADRVAAKAIDFYRRTAPPE